MSAGLVSLALLVLVLFVQNPRLFRLLPSQTGVMHILPE